MPHAATGSLTNITRSAPTPGLGQRRAWVLLGVGFAAILGLSGCQPQDSVKDSAPVAVVSPADAALAAGDFALAAQLYATEALAAAPGPDRERGFLSSVDASLDAGDVDFAVRTFSSLPDPSSRADAPSVLKSQYAAVAARLAVSDRRLADAERALLGADANELSGRWLRTYWAAAADVAGANADPLAETFDRIELQTHLVGADPLMFSNTVRTWRALEALGQEELATLNERHLAAPGAEARGPLLEGWLTLLRTYRLDRADPAVLAAALEGFAARYPDHPAYPELTKQLVAEAEALLERPRQIALLLPLSSPALGPVAAAVRDGFISAYLDESNPEIQPTNVRVYDVADSGEGIAGSYTRAVAEGAQFVVGPLTKDSVETLLASTTLSVPTLVLNRLPANSIGLAERPDTLLQFGLPPEDDAVAIADSAWSYGYRRAITMAPIDPWGQRVVDAFKARWESLGGLVRDAQRYQDEGPAYAEAVARVLGVDESRARAKALESLLGMNLEFRPRPRDDVDFLFIAARPVEARQIMPQIRYFGADSLPVFATSEAFSGLDEDRLDPDLQGLRLVDMPWLLKQYESRAGQSFERAFRARYRGQRRLFALGADAYLLAGVANRLRATGTDVAGLSGRLMVDPQGVVRRTPAWGMFPLDGETSGEPVPGNAVSPSLSAVN